MSSESVETWCVLYPEVTIFEPGKFRVTAGHRWNPLKEFCHNLIKHFPRLTISMAYCEPAQNFAGTVSKHGAIDEWKPRQYVLYLSDERPAPDPARDWKHVCGRKGCPGCYADAPDEDGDASGEGEAKADAEDAVHDVLAMNHGYLVCGRVRQLMEEHGLPLITKY